MPVRSLAGAFQDLDIGRHKAELYRMWLAGYHAGLEHPHVLETLGPFGRSPATEALRQYLLAGTKRRQGIATLVRAKPAHFAPFEAALLILGEETGALEQCLRLLADYFAAEHRMMLWVKQKMTYPLIEMLAAAVIGPLPLLFTRHPALYLPAAAAGLAAASLAGGSILMTVARYYSRQPKLVRARLARALTIAVEAGLPLGRAVELAVAATDDPGIAAHVRAIPARTIGAQPLARTFTGCPKIPREMVATMVTADTTGDYTGTLKKLAELYDGDYARR
ncbi:MAG: type II secretion system F family protein [Gemmatimonadales bacterium]